MNDQYRGPKMNTGIIHLIWEVGAGIIFREYSEKKTIGQHKKSISVYHREIRKSDEMP